MDAGGFNRGYGQDKLVTTEYLLRAMHDMGYSVFNLSPRDFANGGEPLKNIAAKYNIHLLASNTFYEESGKPFTEPWQIIDVKPVKGKSPAIKKISVGVIGLCDPAKFMFNRIIKEPMLTAKDPVKTAKSLAPKLHKKADLVVLLYHGSYATVKEILQTVSDIDVVIMGGQYYMINDREDLGAIMASSRSMGKNAGILTLTLDGNKNIIEHEKQSHALTEQVQDDPKMLQLLQEYDKASAEHNPQSDEHLEP